MFDLTTEDKLFNEFVPKGVTAEIKARSKMFDRVKKDYSKVELGGKYAKIRLLMAGSQATGASSTSSYPTPQESTPGEAFIYIKRAQMFSMKFDGLALESAKKGGAAMDAFDFEQEGLFIQVAEDLSRQLLLDGSGHICQINDADPDDGDKTVTVDSPFYAKATIFVKAGRVLVLDAAGAADELTVDEVTDTTIKFLTEPDAGVANNEWIHGWNTYTAAEAAGKGEMMGLEGIISYADPPVPNDGGLQGLPVATYPEWKAGYVNNVAGDLTETEMTKVLDELSLYAMPTVILTNHGVRRFYADLLTSYKGIYNQKVLWGGWAGLPFVYDGKELPVVADRFVPDGTMYFLSEKHLTLYHTTPNIIKFEQGDSGKYLQKVAQKNEYVAEGHFFGNLGTDLRKAFGKLYGLNEK